MKIPPTAALRAFEAAARHRSFTAAAKELRVTQSAVSHQLRYLEEFWQLRLFERGRQLELTRGGERLLPIVSDFLSGLSAALEELSPRQGKQSLKVSTTQSFAVRWLVPRLAEFQALHPDLQISISTTEQLVDFPAEQVDVAIRLGQGNYPGLHAELLLREQLFPVAAPDLVRRLGTPSQPTDLLRYPLLLRDSAPIVPKWEYWFERAGISSAKFNAGACFPDTNMAIQAALAGHGAALVRSAHVEHELDTARLIRLCDIDCPSPVAYFFVCPKGVERQGRVRAFRKWIFEKASQRLLPQHRR
jgi:LysR family glycine cleavage system transcriptional activator